MARKSLSPCPAQPFPDPCCSRAGDALMLGAALGAALGAGPAGAERPQPGAGNPSRTLRSDGAVWRRGSSPGFLPTYASRFRSPGQLWLPIPTPAALSFWGQELLAQFIFLAASPPSAETCTPVPPAFFPPSLSLLCFLLVFLFKCVK